MNTLDELHEYLEDLIEDFSILEAKSDLFEQLIEMGNDLDDFPNKGIDEINKVPGCVSDVYILVEKVNDHFYFKGYSASKIVSGYVFILIKSLSGLSLSDLEKSETMLSDFVTRSGINLNMTASRADSFANIYKFMILKAKSL